jgi:hypothetical protein
VNIPKPITVCRRFCAVATVLTIVCASPALGAERELDQDPPPSSARGIETPIQRVFPKVPDRPSFFPGVRERLQALPTFFADSQLEARFRTYYLKKDRTVDLISEAWAAGGSIYYRSGWLKDLFAIEAEGFTSQKIYGPSDRDGTFLLAPGQDGYSAFGIANAKLKFGEIVLTGGRQYLDLPYVNRNDSRMTPNTFESITLAKPQGAFRFSTGYTWKIKPRTSEDFLSMTAVLGLDKDRGLAHAGAVWDPDEDFHIGAIGGIVPDLFAGVYGELGIGRDLAKGWELRFDGQFTFQTDTGDDLLGDLLDETWNLGFRTSASYAGAVFRLGLSVTGPDAAIVNPYGTNPSYVDLMQRSFSRADEKALLASVSYDFSKRGFDGLSMIMNFVAGFDGKRQGVGDDRQEFDLTIDYRAKKGALKNFSLRARGSWLDEDFADSNGTDFRVILRYDIPII